MRTLLIALTLLAAFPMTGNAEDLTQCPSFGGGFTIHRDLKNPHLTTCALTDKNGREWDYVGIVGERYNLDIISKNCELLNTAMKKSSTRPVFAGLRTNPLPSTHFSDIYQAIQKVSVDECQYHRPQGRSKHRFQVPADYSCTVHEIQDRVDKDTLVCKEN